MNRQWFWYPHPSLDAYVSVFESPLLSLCIKADNTSSAIKVETDEPRLLDLLRSKRFRKFAKTSPMDDKIPRLTYLHNAIPTKHLSILTRDNILHGSRERTDISFDPLTSRVLLHRPSIKSMDVQKDLKDTALAEFLVAYSFGLVKSLVNGLVSFVEPDGVGCHGAVFELEGKSVALLGATGSGKSTHALRFLLSNQSALLITDDWFIIRYKEPDFIVTALEQQFFARKAQVEEILKYYPYAIPTQQRLLLVSDASRIDMDLRSLLGPNRFIEQAKLDVLVCITKARDGKTELRPMGEAEFITHAITSSPHIPFHSTSTGHYKAVKRQAGHELYSTMLNSVAMDTQFWRNVYERLPVYSLSYSDSIPESTVQALIRQLAEAV